MLDACCGKRLASRVSTPARDAPGCSAIHRWRVPARRGGSCCYRWRVPARGGSCAARAYRRGLLGDQPAPCAQRELGSLARRTCRARDDHLRKEGAALSGTQDESRRSCGRDEASPGAEVAAEAQYPARKGTRGASTCTMSSATFGSMASPGESLYSGRNGPAHWTAPRVITALQSRASNPTVLSPYAAYHAALSPAETHIRACTYAVTD